MRIINVIFIINITSTITVIYLNALDKKSCVNNYPPFELFGQNYCYPKRRLKALLEPQSNNTQILSNLFHPKIYNAGENDMAVKLSNLPEQPLYHFSQSSPVTDIPSFNEWKHKVEEVQREKKILRHLNNNRNYMTISDYANNKNNVLNLNLTTNLSDFNITINTTLLGNQIDLHSSAENISNFDKANKFVKKNQELDNLVLPSYDGDFVNNYASSSCGAKLLNHNQEAINANGIIQKNVDEYMLNPCNTKIWFTMELCEPIQIKIIEIANLELFSSLPKQFRISISDRYPTKEWLLNLTFIASEERKPQKFHFNTNIYTKYLKYELLSHYGSEHYCPLTFIRIYGKNLVEEFVPDDDDEESDRDSGFNIIPDVNNLDLDLQINLPPLPPSLSLDDDKVITTVKDGDENVTIDHMISSDHVKGLVVEDGFVDEINNKTSSDSTATYHSSHEETLNVIHTTPSSTSNVNQSIGSDVNLPVHDIHIVQDEVITNNISSGSFHSSQSGFGDLHLEHTTVTTPTNNSNPNFNHDEKSQHVPKKLMESAKDAVANIINHASNVLIPHELLNEEKFVKKKRENVTVTINDNVPILTNLTESSWNDSLLAVKPSVNVINLSSASSSCSFSPEPSLLYFISPIWFSRFCACCSAISKLTKDAATFNNSVSLPPHSKECFYTAILDALLMEPPPKPLPPFINPAALTITHAACHFCVPRPSRYDDLTTVVDNNCYSDYYNTRVRLRPTIYNGKGNTGTNTFTSTYSVSNTHHRLPIEPETTKPLPAVTSPTPPTAPPLLVNINNNNNNINGGGGGHNHLSPLPSSHKESIFMRLNNRIKTLESNLTLTGRYLDQLSKSYVRNIEDTSANFDKISKAINATGTLALQRYTELSDTLKNMETQVNQTQQVVNALLQDNSNYPSANSLILHYQKKWLTPTSLFHLLIFAFEMIVLLVFVIWIIPFRVTQCLRRNVEQQKRNVQFIDYGLRGQWPNNGHCRPQGGEDDYFTSHCSSSSLTSSPMDFPSFQSSTPLINKNTKNYYHWKDHHNLSDHKSNSSSAIIDCYHNSDNVDYRQNFNCMNSPGFSPSLNSFTTTTTPHNTLPPITTTTYGEGRNLIDEYSDLLARKIRSELGRLVIRCQRNRKKIKRPSFKGSNNTTTCTNSNKPNLNRKKCKLEDRCRIQDIFTFTPLSSLNVLLLNNEGAGKLVNTPSLTTPLPKNTDKVFNFRAPADVTAPLLLPMMCGDNMALNEESSFNYYYSNSKPNQMAPRNDSHRGDNDLVSSSSINSTGIVGGNSSPRCFYANFDNAKAHLNPIISP